VGAACTTAARGCCQRGLGGGQLPQERVKGYLDRPETHPKDRSWREHRHARPMSTSDTTKPGARAPGLCLLSRGAFPRGSGAAARESGVESA
jgi:hypothetical protein